MKRFAYVQTDTVPMAVCAAVMNEAAKNGWEQAGVVMVGMAVQQNAIIPPGGQPPAVPVCIIIFRKEIPANSTEMPEFPEIKLNAGKNESRPGT